MHISCTIVYTCIQHKPMGQFQLPKLVQTSEIYRRLGKTTGTISIKSGTNHSWVKGSLSSFLKNGKDFINL